MSSFELPKGFPEIDLDHFGPAFIESEKFRLIQSDLMAELAAANVLDIVQDELQRIFLKTYNIHVAKDDYSVNEADYQIDDENYGNLALILKRERSSHYSSVVAVRHSVWQTKADGLMQELNLEVPIATQGHRGVMRRAKFSQSQADLSWDQVERLRIEREYGDLPNLREDLSGIDHAG